MDIQTQNHISTVMYSKQKTKQKTLNCNVDKEEISLFSNESCTIPLRT